MSIRSEDLHAVLDYALGFALVVSPWLFAFNYGGSEMYVPIVCGIVVVCYSLVTNYRLSLAKVISLRMNLALDQIVGGFLIFSPWLLGFADASGYGVSRGVWMPHVILGLALAISGGFSMWRRVKPTPAAEAPPERRL
ncbi:SPW repeat protein [soil metagenome]